MNKDGSYFVSKFRSSMCRTHYHSKRSTLERARLDTPGPGSYRLPSDFGYYESKNIKKVEGMGRSQSHAVLPKGDGKKDSL
jgi:hypothetical protein